MSGGESLLHPVRVRIILAMLGAERITAAELHERISDVAIATLYRHIRHLIDFGVVEVIDERSTGGAPQRLMRLSTERALASPDDVRAMGPVELRTLFTAFCAGMLGQFDRYLDLGNPDLIRDRVTFAQADLWATDAEIDEFFGTLGDAIAKLRANGRSAERRSRVLSTVLMPLTPAPPTRRQSNTKRKP